MYYCDMGPLGAEIVSAYKRRTVGQYVIVKGLLPSQLAYRAHTIVSVTADGSMIWYKNRDPLKLTLLTKEEQDVIMLQILKSEIW